MQSSYEKRKLVHTGLSVGCQNSSHLKGQMPQVCHWRLAQQGQRPGMSSLDKTRPSLISQAPTPHTIYLGVTHTKQRCRH